MNKKLFSALLAAGFLFSTAGGVCMMSDAKAEESDKAYSALFSYDFKGDDYGKSDNPAFDLDYSGDLSYDEAKGGLLVKKGGLYAKGFGKQWIGEYDFMDDFVGEKFTISTEFMLPSVVPADSGSAGAGGRSVLFSLWGLWNGASYGGGADSNLVSSSLIYDGYASGATTVNLRLGFLYDVDENTENGWWSRYEKQVTTDEYHTFTLALDGLNIVSYVDGVKFAEFTASEKQAWKNTHTHFAIGCAHGDGGLSSTGYAYYKSFALYDFAMTGEEQASFAAGTLTSVSAKSIASAAEVPSAVSISSDAIEEEILQAAPKKSEVVVTLSDDTTTEALVNWTGVEVQEGKTYLVGDIYAAGATNPNGVKTKMEVELTAPVQGAPAFLEYTFKDSTNVGKSNLGGYFDLVEVGTANSAKAENGVLTLDGKSVLAAKPDANGFDFMDYMNDYTVEVSFKLPEGVAQSHGMILSVNGLPVVDPADTENAWKQNNAAMILARGYAKTDASTILSVGYADADTNPNNGSNGTTSNAFYTKRQVAVQIGKWNIFAYSYNSTTKTISAYLNGVEVATYEVYDKANFKSSEFAFTLGGYLQGDYTATTKAGNAAKISYRSLKVYDYAVAGETLGSLSSSRVMPLDAGTAAAEKKVVSANAATVTVAEANLTEEKALAAVAAKYAEIRVNLQDSDVLKVGCAWDTVTANADGTFTVSGTLIGAYNPDGVKATATVKAASYKVSFVGENATVKVADAATTETTVTHGGSVSFKVEVAEGYTLLSVKAGESALNAVDGVYTLENVTADVSVSVTVEVKAADSTQSTSDTEDKKSGCGSFTVGTALLPLALCGVLFAKKKED